MATGVGFALVGSVVSWRLFASTYARDVTTICYAESESGLRLDRDITRVTSWVHAHLTTGQGGELFAWLRDEPLRNRATDLQARALAAGTTPCPLAQSYEALRAETDYREDVQELCSRFTFPGLAEVAPAARVQRLAEWLEADARSARARALAAQLRLGLSARESTLLLRDEAIEAGVFTCDVAAMLQADAALACETR